MKKMTLLSVILVLTNLLSAQWVQQNPHYPDSSVLHDIFFIDSQKGWANGTGPESNPEMGNYYFTHDGGLNWYSWNDSVWYVFLPMNSIMFANEDDGFGIWQNTFYTTSNGGISWWNWTLNGYEQYVFTDIFFTDSMHGWTVGFDEMGLGHGDIKILNTTDGGDNWEEKFSVYKWLIGVDQASVKFIDQYSGWAAAGNGVLFTDDGGNTWNETSLNLYCNSLCIIDENNLWTAGFYYVEGDSNVGGIYNSNNGGISWIQMLGDTIPFLNDITFVNDISGWAVGNSGTILHTEDGGNTWVYQASGTTADLHSICFVDENEGWICGDSSIILYTDNGGISDHCLPEGITFATQAQVDSFAINNPGCTEIEGAVYIGPSDNITNLDGLSVLTSIGGELIINLNTVLNNLSGLGNLTSIGEGFGIGGNDALISLSGLDNLTFIGGGLIIGNWLIGGNPTLSSLNGLESLTSIGGELVISYNDDLNSLIGLDNIDAASITNLIIINNSSLSTCEFQSICDYLTSPNGTITIENNAPGCNSEAEVEEACSSCLPEGITFTTQAQIDSFAIDYPGCTEIEGDVIIGDYSGSNINNLSGLDVLTFIGGDLFIRGNDALLSLTGLEGINSIGGDLEIYPNDALTSLAGFEGLTSIGGNLRIMHNEALSSLAGFDNLTSIGGDVWIADNIALTSLMGLDNVTSIGNDIHITDNKVLTSLSGLEGLTSVEGALQVGRNRTLNSLMGLDNVTSVGGWLSIFINRDLTNLSGLEGLTSIGGLLYIVDNDALASLNGLENIECSSIDSLQIQGNNLLSTCDVQSICDYLASPEGHIYISENAPGCNSPQEVEDACSFFVPDHADTSDILLYPNPATNELFIVCSHGIQLTEVNIYNQLGQKVLQVYGNTQQLDVSMLSKGLYVAELITDKSKIRRKLLLE